MSAALSSPAVATEDHKLPRAVSKPDAAIETPVNMSTEPSAAGRLTESRNRMRAAMMEISHPPKRASLLGTGGGGGDFIARLLSRVKALPAAAIVIESVEVWWQQHPLRTVGVVAEEAARAFVKPIAQRSPQTLIFGAATLGALFALTRPWRWLLRPALFVGLVPQLMAQAMKRMPVESWVKMVASILGRKVANASKTTAAPAARSTQPEI